MVKVIFCYLETPDFTGFYHLTTLMLSRTMATKLVGWP